MEIDWFEDLVTVPEITLTDLSDEHGSRVTWYISESQVAATSSSQPRINPGPWLIRCGTP